MAPPPPAPAPAAARALHRNAPARSGAYAAFTCLGVVAAPPADVWALVADPVGAWPAWLTSVERVEACGAAARLPCGGSAFRIALTVRMGELGGKRLRSCMLVAVVVEEGARGGGRVRASLAEPNVLMRQSDTVFEVRALDAGAAAALLAAPPGGMPRARVAAALAAGAPPRPGAWSVVVLTQRVSPRAAPPPPFGRLLKAHLGGVFEGMLTDLQVACGGAASRADSPPSSSSDYGSASSGSASDA
jgi:hypothetical protein